jgi:hypothetical protein
LYQAGQAQGRFNTEFSEINTGLGLNLGRYGVLKSGLLLRNQKVSTRIGSDSLLPADRSSSTSAWFALADLDRDGIADQAGGSPQITAAVGEGVDAQGKSLTRNVCSGIASMYQPQDLVGKLTVLVANLAPRKMKFGLSEGMVLAASHADEKAEPGIYILEPFPGAKPGMRIH